MLSLYGWRVWALLQSIAELKGGLSRTMGAWDDARAPTIETNPDNGINSEGLLINTTRSFADEIGMVATRYQLNTLMVMSMTRAPLSEFLAGMDQLAVRIQEDLKTKPFLFVPAEMAGFWGKKDAFSLGNKFKDALPEIMSAGNCLAIGEGTACVMHLNRAMDTVLTRLARRLRITIGPRDTWGVILNAMSGKINTMPQDTKTEKNKRDKWSEVRVHLFHVKEAWRDRSFHNKENYSPARAKEIYEAVRVFITHFATL